MEQELKRIWKNSSEIERVKFDLSRLLLDLNGRINKLEKAISRRDKRDIRSSILMIPVFGYLAYEVPFPISKVGLIFTAIMFGVTIYKLRQVKSHKHPADLAIPFLDQLKNKKAYLLQEAKLLDTILYWSLIPSFLAHLLVIIGFGDPKEYGWDIPFIHEILPAALIYKIIYMFFVALLFAAILWANRNVIRKSLKPVIEEVEKVIVQLEKED